MNFLQNTTRQCDFKASQHFYAFLLNAVKKVKYQDMASRLTDQELNRRGRKSNQRYNQHGG